MTTKAAKKYARRMMRRVALDMSSRSSAIGIGFVFCCEYRCYGICRFRIYALNSLTVELRDFTASKLDKCNDFGS